MTERKFDNNYNIIVCAFSLLITHFVEEDNIFAAQCIWWLASIIQYTKIFKFYLEYQIFPWVYVRDCVVTPLPKKVPEETLIPDSNIPEIQLESDMDDWSETIKQDVAEARSILPNVQRTHSGRIVKPVHLSNQELRNRYPVRSQQQLNSLRVSLLKDGLILYAGIERLSRIDIYYWVCERQGFREITLKT